MTHDEFKTKVEQVRSVLGWSHLAPLSEEHPDDDRFTISGFPLVPGSWRSEAQLYMSYDSYTKRIRIAGSYPYDWDHRTNVNSCEHISITVAETKTADQIARDISKRVLPEYLHNLDKIIERNARSLADHLKKVEQLNVLASVLNTEYQWEGYGQHRNYGQHSYTLWRVDPINGVKVRAIESMYDGTIRFQLEDMSLEAALKVIETLKEIIPHD